MLPRVAARWRDTDQDFDRRVPTRPASSLARDTAGKLEAGGPAHREARLSGSQPNASPAVSLQLAPPRARAWRAAAQQAAAGAACGAGVIVATAVGYTYHLRAAQSVASAAAEAQREPKPASGQQALAGAPESGHIETAQAEKPAAAKLATTDTAAPTGPAVDEQAIVARKQAWADYYQALQQRRQQLVQAETQALTADPTVSGAVGVDGLAGTAAAEFEPCDGLGAGLLQPVLTGVRPPPPGAAPPALAGNMAVALRAIWRRSWPGARCRDRRQWSAVWAAFLRAARGDRGLDYLQASLKPPVSPFEVQAGR